jgi:uncharacterized protein (DUF2147 family)
MTIRTIAGFCAALSLLFACSAFAAGSDDILGTWYNQEKDAQIELYKCDAKYCGRIVWLKEPNYPEGSKEGTPGTPKRDFRNPDAAHQNDPIIGLNIVKDFMYDGGDRWTDGTVYDPKNGKTYRGRMTLAAPDRLDLRGYIGIPLIGRTTTWTRAEAGNGQHEK